MSILSASSVVIFIKAWFNAPVNECSTGESIGCSLISAVSVGCIGVLRSADLVSTDEAADSLDGHEAADGDGICFGIG